MLTPRIMICAVCVCECMGCVGVGGLFFWGGGGVFGGGGFFFFWLGGGGGLNLVGWVVGDRLGAMQALV